MKQRIALGCGVPLAAFATLVACSSFDATSDTVTTAGDGGPSGSDASGDGATSDPDGGWRCTAVVDEPFTTGHTSMRNLVQEGGGTCGVDGGVLVSTSPRPGPSQAQVENDETPRGNEQLYKLAFSVKGSVLPALSGDLVRVGCTLKLIDVNNELCNVFVMVGGDKLRADVDCSNSSTPSTVLLPLDGTQSDLRILIDTLVDPTGTSFSAHYGVAGGPTAQQPGPFALAPVKWQIKCGIDEAKLVDLDGGVDGGDAGAAYDVAVDDVRLDLCER